MALCRFFRRIFKRPSNKKCHCLVTPQQQPTGSQDPLSNPPARLIPQQQMMVPADRAEEKYQEAMGTIAQLEKEKRILMNQVETLKQTVVDLEKYQAMLRGDQNVPNDGNNRMLDTDNVLQDGDKYKEEKLECRGELPVLRTNVEVLEQEPHHTLNQEEYLKVLEQEEEARMHLISEYKEMLDISQRLQEATQSDAEKRYQKAMEAMDQLFLEFSDQAEERTSLL